MKYFLIVGEASGDLHASRLMREIALHDPQAEFCYFGGEQMAAVGGTLVCHYRDTAFMGYLTVLRNWKKVLNNFRVCYEAIDRFAPDLLILVDYPGFNLKIAADLRKRGFATPIYYYIAPKVWAWKEGRIRQIRRYVDRVFSILPFEPTYFARQGMEVEYVGNPSLDEVEAYLSAPTLVEAIEATDMPRIALFPGSRRHEIEQNLPQMIAAAERLGSYEIIISGAPNIDISLYRSLLNGRDYPVVMSRSFELFRRSDLAVVVSGTATLECALFRVPQVIVYGIAGGRLVYWFYRRLIKTRFVSLVNLIVGRQVCRELLGYQATADRIYDEIYRIHSDASYRRSMLDGYDDLRTILGNNGAAAQAAKSIIKSIQLKN